jgi:diguanylate cyclase (GGDEF)-like protein
MIELLYKSEATIRLSVFLGSFSLLALWEFISPRRKPAQGKLKRWLNNVGLLVLSTLIVRLIVPTAAVGVAYLAEETNLGLMSYIDLPFWPKVAVSFILLDFLIYLQHAMFHVLPLMWRFHRVHHSDPDCDVSTGLRFHPVEMFISICFKMLIIFILGAPVLAVILFEIVLNLMSMFTHSNIGLNRGVERFIRYGFVTPDMHRIHYSTRENETNSNFGFNFSLWDRLFGTYMAAPKDGHQNMTIGLNRFREANWQAFQGLLFMPMVKSMGGYAINYRDTRNADELELARKLAEENAEKARLADELAKANEQLEELARLDGLTNIFNRRYFDETLRNEIKRHNRTQSRLTVILGDIDYFKNYNDTYGHQAGDDCLKQIAQCLWASFNRAGDVVARFGGEEFAIILPETKESAAMMLSEGLLQKVRELNIKHESSKTSQIVTISIGVGTVIPDKNTVSADLVEIADKALYQAKQSGRDNVQSISSCRV